MAESAPGSPEWWLRKLEKQLDEQAKRVDLPDRYYRGLHDLRFASTKFEKTFGKMFMDAADNWMPLIVDSVQERLRVQGFRVGDKTDGDARVWKIWQANNLDADSDVEHTEALIGGSAYAQVWYNPDDDKLPHVFIEHASQVTIAYSPENRRIRLAALKRWEDDDGVKYATLYLPNEIYKFSSLSRSGTSLGQWKQRNVPGENWPMANPLGVVPVVEISARRRMLDDPMSEITAQIATQDKINKLTFDMMVAAEYAAYRQRWATGLEVPVDPDTNLPIEPFQAAVDRLWISNSKDTSFGEFGVTELANYVDTIEMQVQHLASQSRTPPHYIFVRGNMPSGESLRSAETGLVRKVEAYQRGYGEGWEEVMRLALNIAGVRIKGAESMSTLWADAETQTESEHIDSTLKKLSMGVPLLQIWRDAGYSDEDVAGFRDMLKDEKDYRQILDDARPAAPTSEGQTIDPTATAAGVSADDSAS